MFTNHWSRRRMESMTMTLMGWMVVLPCFAELQMLVEGIRREVKDPATVD
jgi:hypothetical protein